ncbi:DUF1883 domain-containing protein [Flavobacterium sp. MAH-1]|uniref:DUF1883 domain-containing protein n=1 Tax=Flavobacterium agri TaxID=2743471 RepID=A0A7Y9C519_9FLAO|nr:DUF1883 domain-containing protein [Flavobacterium agri]NYA70500.1 DUF1883 domain-containing protein [Flavobacterium agri]
MQFIHYDLGMKGNRKTVKLELSGSAANVRLMDANNLELYKRGRRYKYIGGLVLKSPIFIDIPHLAHWHLAIDMQGLIGEVRTNFKILERNNPS